MVSEIQGKILAMIATSDGMRYSEAYPGEGIDDDLYNYHLRELVKRGYLEKVDKKYKLTNDGKKELVNLNSHGEEVGRIKLITILVVTRDNLKEILIHKRNRHPHRGEISTVSGKVQAGEMIEDAAKRRLREETGLVAEFEHWVDFRVIRKTTEGKLFEDIIFSVCTAKEPTGTLITSNEFGENWWDDFNKIYEYEEKNMATAKIETEILREIQKGIKSSKPIKEEVVVLSSY